MGAKASSRRLQVARGYRRLLVPLDARAESVKALEIACRLAADDGATITAVAVIEVPPLLPLDAHLTDAEDAARRLLERAGATGDAWGVSVATRVVRARDVGAAIVEQATADRPSSSSAPLSGYLDSHPTTSERLAYLRERSR